MKTFTCKECGGHRLHEVMTCVDQFTEIIDIDVCDDGTPCLSYGEHSLDGGEVKGYECLTCFAEVSKEELLALVDDENSKRFVIEGSARVDVGDLVTFDTEEWFKQASDDDIRKLFGKCVGEYIDGIAEWVANNMPATDLREIFILYYEKGAHLYCTLDMDDVKDWLETNRPKLFQEFCTE